MTEDALEELLSRPTADLVQEMSHIAGDLLILGAGGKMGPSLARLAVRASQQAGVARKVVAVARFTDPTIASSLEQAGVDILAGDLFDRRTVAQLPEVPNVIYMVGQKFGTAEAASRTWAVNAYLPALVAERFPRARIVAFSTGNVYPLSPVSGPGPSESDPTGPVGEYAQSALARERVLEFFSQRLEIPMVILRLNYAVEPRYGVLRDIAEQVRSQQPVDVTMGWVNVIWQRDANAIALRALAHCRVPPLVLNLTGRPALSVRWLAQRFAERWGLEARFRGDEAATALLSNAARAEALFGPNQVTIDEMMDRVAEWLDQGGRSLGKPTHYEMREGIF